MALSKQQCVSDVNANIEITIPTPKIIEFCRVSCPKAVSIEIIDHLIGGDNMEYKAMEVENSFQCYTVCRDDLLQIVKSKIRGCYSSKIAKVQPLMWL